MTTDRILLQVLDAILVPPCTHKTLATYGVPYTPCVWFGPLTSAQRHACRRAVRELVSKGYVCRVTDPTRNRTRYLRPTLDGVCRAVVLSDVKRDSVVAQLRRLPWAREWADQLASNPDWSMELSDLVTS